MAELGSLEELQAAEKARQEKSNKIVAEGANGGFGVVPTVKIVSSHPKSQGDFIEINASDYDANVHELYGDEKAPNNDLDRLLELQRRAAVIFNNLSDEDKAKLAIGGNRSDAPPSHAEPIPPHEAGTSDGKVLNNPWPAATVAETKKAK